MPEKIEPLPAWLHASIAEIGKVHVKDGIGLVEAETLRDLLGMAELDELPTPLVVGDKTIGVTAVWERDGRKFAIHVVADLVEFSTWARGRRRPIPPVHLRMGRAGVIREQLCWLFGYGIYPSRGADLLAAAGGGRDR